MSDANWYAFYVVRELLFGKRAMLSRKVLLSCAISIFVFACRHDASYASEEHEWFGDHVRAGQVLRILTDIEVEKDLSMTPQQRKTLNELKTQHQRQFGEVMRRPKDWASKSDAEKNAYSEKHAADLSALENEFRPQILKTLTDSQPDRLHQIIWQLNVARSITEESKVTSRIKLEPEQKVAIGEIIDQYKKDVKAKPDERPRTQDARFKLIERWEEAEAKRDEHVLAILTDSQRSEWSTLTGKSLDVVALRPRINLSRSDMPRLKAMPQEGLQEAPTSSAK